MTGCYDTPQRKLLVPQILSLWFRGWRSCESVLIFQGMRGGGFPNAVFRIHHEKAAQGTAPHGRRQVLESEKRMGAPIRVRQLGEGGFSFAATSFGLPLLFVGESTRRGLVSDRLRRFGETESQRFAPCAPTGHPRARDRVCIATTDVGCAERTGSWHNRGHRFEHARSANCLTLPTKKTKVFRCAL